MKIKIVSMENQELRHIELPKQFSESISKNLVQRAVLALQAAARTKYGAAPRAGKRSSAKLSRRRRHYRGAYGYGISRVPRKIMSRSGTRFNWEGAFAPGMKGGRQAHPPKASKEWSVKINKKERRKAIRSALAATMQPEIVQARHKLPAGYPFAVESRFEELQKTKDVKKVLTTLQFGSELERAGKRKIRPGRGKMRARRYRSKTGPLLVVSKNSNVMRAARNLPGVDVVAVNSLNAQLLAPGREPGRLALFTEAALEKMQKEGLFA